MNSRRLTIYGNWSAYDELSDGVPLTEKLAMRQFKELLRLREHGVRFDAYLMDAFWFDPDGGYRTWRTPNWPNGPQRWLDACGEHDLLPGLWFTANTLCHLKTAPNWLDSADDNEWGLCCFHGGFLADYLDVLGYWYDQGVRIFKLDFADFTAAPSFLKAELSAGEIRQKNIEAFRTGLRNFRNDHPDAIIMGFNGFEFKEYMDRTDRPLEKVIDLEWLDVFDSIYSGDPRPADVPTVPFWRSVDIYGDHTTRVLEYSGVPLNRIDNCGFMAGPTGTCYWRGKAMWKGMFILTLARGGDLTVLYGDLSLFSNEDARWMGRVQALFERAFQNGPASGFGYLPGEGGSFGWVIGDGLCAVVNPNPGMNVMRLPGASWQLIFADAGAKALVDNDEAAKKNEGNAVAALGPYQLALFARGGYPLGAYPLGIQEDCESIHAQINGFDVVEQSGGSLVVEAPPGKLRVVVSQFDGDGKRVRTFASDGSAALAPSIRAFQLANELKTVQHHDHIIWSGISWGAADIVATGDAAVRIEVVATDQKVAKLDLMVFRLE